MLQNSTHTHTHTYYILISCKKKLYIYLTITIYFSPAKKRFFLLDRISSDI